MPSPGLNDLARRAWAPEADGWPGLVSRLLGPIGLVYGLAGRIRIQAFARGRSRIHRAAGPVISVGNLTVGGLGKTPLTMELARWLLDQGRRPAVVLRGYGGSVGPGPKLVAPDCPPDQVGDEALLYLDLPGLIVVVGSDRPAGADLAFGSGAEVVLLDDGFQHLPLARDLDIVLLDADQPLANGRIFPAGPLRESPAALNRADAFILTRAEDPTKAEAAKAFLRQAGFEQPIWTARHIVDRAVDPADGRPLDLSGKKIALVCGLARPDQAARSLEKLGPASIDLISLADHQVYDQALVRRIEDRTAGADLVIATAKDWVKLRLVKERSRPIGVTDLRIEIDQAESLKRLVLEAAAGRGRIPGMVARRPRRKPIPRTGRLLVRMPNWVGDAVMAEPVLRNLKLARPDLSLTLLAAQWSAPLFRDHPAVDEVIAYHRDGEHAGLTGRLKMARRMKGYDACLLLPNSFDSALLARLAGSPRRIGYARDGRSLLLTDRVPLNHLVKQGHQIDYYLALLTYLGLPAPFRRPRLTVDWPSADFAGKFIADLPGDREPLIGLAPGAAFGPAKRWPEGHFAQATGRLLEQYGGKVLVFGSSAEAEAAQALTDRLGPAAINLAGRTDLDQAVALIDRLDLLITNDSGLMHVADALDAPLIALFGSTSPQKTGPRGDRSRILSVTKDCAPCFKPVCPKNEPCLDLITVDRVVAAAEKILDTKE